MKERRILLIRHAKPEFSVKTRGFIGRTDLELSQDGMLQAQALAERLKQEEICHIYTSPLKRALHTAEIIAVKLGLTPCINEKLAEIDLGEWEGKAFTEIQRRYPQEFEARGRNLLYYRTPGGESFYDVFIRAWSSFQVILAETEGSIALISHKGVNRVLLCHILQRPLQELLEIEQDYGCTNLIVQEGKKLKLIETK